MIKEPETAKPSSRYLEIIGLVFLILIVIGGVYLIITGTGAAAIGRYMAPPQILPGVVLVYIFAVALAFAIVKNFFSFSFAIELRKTMLHKLNPNSAERLRNMALLLTFFIVAFAMTEANSLRTPSFARSYVFGLFVNIFSAVVSSVGVFGWSAYLFLSKNTKEKL